MALPAPALPRRPTDSHREELQTDRRRRPTIRHANALLALLCTWWSKAWRIPGMSGLSTKECPHPMENSMKHRTALLIATMIAIAPTAWAQTENVETMKAPGHASIKGTSRMTATVDSIDAATRTVTLKTQQGKMVEVEVGPEARNFDQLKVGDVVTTVYRESLSLSLKKNGTEPASISEQPSMERAAKGQKPGGTLGRQVTIVADVIAVHPKTKTVTLKGPKGNIVDLVVEDPEQIANIKKGDQVEAVYTEALAISVEPAVKK
jgi:Cu/Ag efflux protein CusF